MKNPKGRNDGIHTSFRKFQLSFRDNHIAILHLRLELEELIPQVYKGSSNFFSGGIWADSENVTVKIRVSAIDGINNMKVEATTSVVRHGWRSFRLNGGDHVVYIHTSGCCFIRRNEQQVTKNFGRRSRITGKK
jgi:hypothetical protein